MEQCLITELPIYGVLNVFAIAISYFYIY